MSSLKNIAVYCASSTRLREEYYAAARRFGELLAQEHLTLVFGAGNMGVMGAVADGVVAAGGEMIGVIPQFMVEKDWHHKQCTELIVTKGMSDRKQTIERISDALVALPGGIGTLDELSEALVNKQLGLHSLPIVILNTNHFYDPFLHLMDHYLEEKLMNPIFRDMFIVVDEPEEVIPAIKNAPVWNQENIKHAKF